MFRRRRLDEPPLFNVNAPDDLIAVIDTAALIFIVGLGIACSIGWATS